MCPRLDNESALLNRDNHLEEKIYLERSPKKQQLKCGCWFKRCQETEKKERRNLVMCVVMNIKEREGRRRRKWSAALIAA